MSAFQSIGQHYHDRDLYSQHHSDSPSIHNRDMRTLAERLAWARQEKGWSQPELARVAGVKNQSTVGMLESGARKSSSYIPALANALGVSALWLADGKGSPTPADATGPAHQAPELREPPSTDIEQMSIEARAKILAEQAAEVASLWMALPEPQRSALLSELRGTAGHPAGDARIMAPHKRKPGTVTPDIKGRQAGD